MARNKIETQIEKKIIHELEKQGWFVKKVHGSGTSKNWPDLFCAHKVYGKRWIEIKQPRGRLSGGQIKEFIKWSEHLIGIWILTRVEDIYKLKYQPNFPQYLRLQQDNCL